jgi:hypothetical protein
MPCGRSGRERGRNRRPLDVALEITDCNEDGIPTKITVKSVNVITSSLTTRHLKCGEKLYLLHCAGATDSCCPEQFDIVIIAIQHGHIKKPQLSDALTEGRNFSEFHILEVSNKQLLSGPVVFTAFI